MRMAGAAAALRPRRARGAIDARCQSGLMSGRPHAYFDPISIPMALVEA
jgi:hypothetical protein